MDRAGEGGVVVTLEEAQEVGGGVDMVHDWKVLLFVANQAQEFHKEVSEPPLGLTNVEEATSEAADAIDHISGCAGKHLSNVEGFFGSLEGGEGGDVG
eukprot:g31045.t1